MKKFITFYRKTEAGDLRQCCGSMATIQIDGRLSRTTAKHVANEHAKANKYDGFQLQHGECIRTMRPLELWVHKIDA